MKYRDPVTGEFKEISVKSGDTLPIGTIVEYDGTTIPDGYEEVDEPELTCGFDGQAFYNQINFKDGSKAKFSYNEDNIKFDYFNGSTWESKANIKVRDTGWVNVNSTVKYRRIGNVVTVTGYSGGAINLANNDYKVVCTLPEEVRPSTSLHFHWTRIGAGGAIAKVNTNGDIQLFADTATSYWAFTFTYVV